MIGSHPRTEEQRMHHFIDVCFLDYGDQQTHEYTWEQLQEEFGSNSILITQIIGLKKKDTAQIIIDFNEGIGEIIIWESPDYNAMKESPT